MKYLLIILTLFALLFSLPAHAVVIGWDQNAAGTEGYVLYWQKASGGMVWNKEVIGVATTTYTIPEINLEHNVEYNIWAKAYDSARTLSASSNVIQYTRVVDKVPPDNLPTLEFPAATAAPPVNLNEI